MKKILSLAVSLVLAAFLLCSGLTTFALSFNGTTSASGDGSSTTAATGGYAIPDMIANNSNRAVGYRFSVIDKTGAVKKAAYDVFRYKTRTTYSKNYSAYEKFSTKYAKTYLKSKYTTLKITTSTSTASCSHDTDWELELPELTTGLKAWCTDARMKTILSKIWNITISNLETNRWAVLVEPIFPIKLESTYHSLTPTEIAVYGAARFGKTSNGRFLDNYTTNEDGTLTLPTDYEYGSYELYEVKSSDGYLLNTYAVPFTVNGNIEVKLPNKPQKAKILIEKKWEVFASVNETDGIFTPVYEEKYLANAVFNIIAKEDIVTTDGTARVSKGAVADTVTTNSEDKAESKELYLGKYIVTETTAPKGTVLDGEPKEVALTYTGETVSVIEAVITVPFFAKLNRRIRHIDGGISAVFLNYSMMVEKSEYIAAYFYIAFLYGFMQWRVPKEISLIPADDNVLECFITEFGKRFSSYMEELLNLSEAN